MIIHVRRRREQFKNSKRFKVTKFSHFDQTTLEISIMGNCCGSKKDDYEKYSPEIEQRISNSPDERVKA